MKKQALYRLAVALSLAGYVWLSWNFLDGGHSPTMCLIKGLTGVPCPSCGTTRALVSLAHGDVAGSALLNPFGLLLAGGLVVVPLWITLDLLRKSNSFLRWYSALERAFAKSRWIPLAGAALVILNWIWNITKGL